MLLTEIITEIGYEVDRTGIDDRVKFWLQQGINTAYVALPKEERQRIATLTTAPGEQAVNEPSDFGDIIAMYNAGKVDLRQLTPADFFAQNRASASDTPEEFIYWNRQFLFSPIPDAAVPFTLNYNIEHPNIYVHNLTIEHKASMSGYVQVYVDENGISVGEGKLLFVSPTAEDAKVWIQTANKHRHEVTIYHDAAAATNGVPWYFDETATNAYERNFFISPTKAATSIKTDNFRKHHHYLNFIHNPDPTTFPDANNVAVYIDEDNVDRTLRLAFISPTTTSGTNELVHTSDGSLPGMLERYHPVVFELAVAKGQRFNKNYEWAAQHAKAASGLMSLITGKPTTIISEEVRQE